MAPLAPLPCGFLTGVLTDFICYKTVSLFVVIEKEGGYLIEQSNCLPKQSKGGQCREVRWPF